MPLTLDITQLRMAWRPWASRRPATSLIRAAISFLTTWPPGKFENLAIAPHGEGIIAMTMDPARGRLYGLTWPTGYFIRFDLRSKELKDLGRTSALGESVRGPQYRTLCRSLVVDPRDGVGLLYHRRWAHTAVSL